jgi:putative aminopeptidase FrvX
MKTYARPASLLRWVCLLLAWDCGWAAALDAALLPALPAASNSFSVFLSPEQRMGVVRTFVQLVQIKSPSREEEAVRRELCRRLTAAGARELPCGLEDAQAPRNLAMEFAATPGFAQLPALLLNAHMDTIAECAPEGMRFAADTGDFFHQNESDRTQSSSFGGDDKSALAVIVETLTTLQTNCWNRGTGHRRIVVIFTACEETGTRGARYLSSRCPELFAQVDLSLTLDGPLDYRSGYPRETFVLVVAKQEEQHPKYKRIIELTGQWCREQQKAFGKTEVGLGMGDFARFPQTACAGLHVRSPVRGFHSRERVKIQDLINHVDLLCYLLLAWDNQWPQARPR